MLSLLLAYLLDRWLGDPSWLPHPVVAMGRAISACEHRLNRGGWRRMKGAIMAIGLVALTYALTALLLFGVGQLSVISPWLSTGLSVLLRTMLIFYGLAGTTLVREVRGVFAALDRSLDEGRRQVARIVGRDTAELSDQEVRKAALETLAENLSDGVVAPLFWLALLGIPGMMAYKMVNTLDSMVGYRNARYREFGCFAARMDDVANFIPARLTAILMLLSTPHGLRLWPFVRKYGPQHASPNAGWPEASLAGILGCRFGGPHNYFGEEVWKPFIGDVDRPLNANDMQRAVRVNRRTEVCMLVLTALVIVLI